MNKGSSGLWNERSIAIMQISMPIVNITKLSSGITFPQINHCSLPEFKILKIFAQRNSSTRICHPYQNCENSSSVINFKYAFQENTTNHTTASYQYGKQSQLMTTNLTYYRIPLTHRVTEINMPGCILLAKMNSVCSWMNRFATC